MYPQNLQIGTGAGHPFLSIPQAMSALKYFSIKSWYLVMKKDWIMNTSCRISTLFELLDGFLVTSREIEGI